MKSRIASRAHSFKEALFGHHTTAALSPVNGGSGNGNGFFEGKTTPASPASSPNNNIHLAKKTGSTDNLIGETKQKRRSEFFAPFSSLPFLQDTRSRSTRPRGSSAMSSWRSDTLR